MPAAKPRPGSLKNNERLDLCELLGSTWEGYYLVGQTDSQGLFQHSHWRRPFEAYELNGLFYRIQQVRILEFEVARLKKELAAAQDAAEKAEHAAEFYRFELRCASKLGLMFSKFET